MSRKCTRSQLSGEHLKLPSAVRRLGRRGQDLDAQVGRVTDRQVEIDEVRSGRPEEDDVKLGHVVLGKDDVDRGADGKASNSVHVIVEPLDETDLRSVMTVEFELDGQPFTALNGGPQFTFTEAVSLQVICGSQQEIDQSPQRTAGHAGGRALALSRRGATMR